MLGKLNPDSKEVTIVGAGISGLLAAYYLDRKGYWVCLLEAESRSGGLLSTRSSSLGLIESAAHSFPASPTLVELCKDLGVELCPLRPEAKARWIFRNDRPRKMPLSIFEIIRTFLKAYFVLAPSRDPETLTLEDWARRFLGESALRYLMNPFVRGIYGAEPREILVSAAFPSLCIPRGHSFISFLLAKRFRKNPPVAVKRKLIVMPRGPISAPKNGMQELVSALEKRLSERLGDRFVKHSRVESISNLELKGNLLLCVPASEAARLISAESQELAEMISKVEYSPLTTATLFTKTTAFANRKSIPRGLGVLVPGSEHRKCLGILYNSSAFEGRVSDPSVVSLTMMLDNSVDDNRLNEVIRAELSVILGSNAAPLETHIRRWDRAVPKYNSHLLKTWECAEKTWCANSGRVLFGNYTGQVSIRGMAELASRL